MTVIDVPDMGRILVRQAGLREEPGGVFRRFHKVGFRYPNGGTEWYDIGSPTFRFGSQYTFSLYDTVSTALSFYVADGADSADDWDVATEIPIGWAHASRHTYRVTGDGCESWTIGDKYRSKRVRLTRYHNEPIGDAVSRCLATWSGWEDAGTFDSITNLSDPSDRWYTVPVESEPDRNGDIPCVSHSVRFAGEVTAWLDRLAEEWTEDGTAWR